MKKFTVTEKAMRPATPARECFYCNAPIGAEHEDSCVLVRKKIRLHARVPIPGDLDVDAEYVTQVPASWDAADIHHYYNDGTWCVLNLPDDIAPFDAEAADRLRGYQDCYEVCGCNVATITYLGELADGSEPYLDEG